MRTPDVTLARDRYAQACGFESYSAMVQYRPRVTGVWTAEDERKYREWRAEGDKRVESDT